MLNVLLCLLRELRTRHLEILEGAILVFYLIHLSPSVFQWIYFHSVMVHLFNRTQMSKKGFLCNLFNKCKMNSIVYLLIYWMLIICCTFSLCLINKNRNRSGFVDGFTGIIYTHIRDIQACCLCHYSLILASRLMALPLCDGICFHSFIFIHIIICLNWSYKRKCLQSPKEQNIKVCADEGMWTNSCILHGSIDYNLCSFCIDYLLFSVHFSTFWQGCSIHNFVPRWGFSTVQENEAYFVQAVNSNNILNI